MARINIEDRLKDDIRFTQDLVAKLGDYEKALGACVRAWIIAQDYWRQGQQPIPLEVWNKQRLNNALIEVDLAVAQESGIYVRGAKECFDWLYQRTAAGQRGGQRSGESRRSNINDLERSKTKQNEANSSKRSKSNLHVHVQVHDQVPIQAQDQVLSSLPEPVVKSSTKDSENNRKIWLSYFNAYRLRYGIDPVRNAAVNAQVAAIRKKLGVDDAIKVVAFYLGHKDSFYIKNTHSFGLCLRDSETLRTQMLLGKGITQNDIRRFEKANATAEMIEEAKLGGF